MTEKAHRARWSAVEIDTARFAIAGVTDVPDFVKIDVEGAEYACSTACCPSRGVAAPPGDPLRDRLGAGTPVGGARGFDRWSGSVTRARRGERRARSTSATSPDHGRPLRARLPRLTDWPHGVAHPSSEGRAPPTAADRIALANQKGGVAKTTSVASLGAALAEQGQRVLLVDLDPQACLTFWLGVEPDAVEPSVHDVLTGAAAIGDIVLTCEEGIDLVPSAIDLAGAEAISCHVRGASTSCAGPRGGHTAYDVVLLDCSPSLGVLTLNALTAADEVIIPMPCEMLSHRGVGQLLDTVADVQRSSTGTSRSGAPAHPLRRAQQPRPRGAGRRRASGTVPVLEPPIPKTVRFAEAPAVGRSILATARTSKGAQAYRDVAASLLRGCDARSQRFARPAHGE